MVDRHGSLECRSRRGIGRRPAGTNWPSVTPPTMTRTNAVVAAAVCRMSAAETNPDHGDEADGARRRRPPLQNARMREGHLEVPGCKDPLAEFETDDIREQSKREHERRRNRRFGGQHPASGRRGREGGPDHAGRVLRRHTANAKRCEQHGADENDTEQ